MKFLVKLLAVGFVAIQFVRPARTNPLTEPGLAITSRDMPGGIAAVFDRSCRDCHSNDTRWPWYSNIAPASWLVIDHVNHGRSHFNYSVWQTYGADQQGALVRNSCKLARAGSMPMPSYLLLHRSARLTPADVETLCSWAVPAPSH